VGSNSPGRQVDSKTVWKKEPVIDMGFTAYFKDPEGRIVGLWQSARVQPAITPQKPPLLSHPHLSFSRTKHSPGPGCRDTRFLRLCSMKVGTRPANLAEKEGGLRAVDVSQHVNPDAQVLIGPSSSER